MYSYNTLTEAPEAAGEALRLLERIAPDKHTTLASYSFRQISAAAAAAAAAVVVGGGGVDDDDYGDGAFVAAAALLPWLCLQGVVVVACLQSETLICIVGCVCR